MRVGITGHQRLKDPSGWRPVKEEMERILVGLPRPLIGITSLAVGADQLFAEAILEQGDSFEAIIPFVGYELKFPEGVKREKYQCLLKKAIRVETLQKTASEEDAYFAAGKRVVDLADLLMAVWDGKPAAGLGGTADIVTYAIQREKRIIHLNPIQLKPG